MFRYVRENGKINIYRSDPAGDCILYSHDATLINYRLMKVNDFVSYVGGDPDAKIYNGLGSKMVADLPDGEFARVYG